ncbi:hypothetical protein SLE2022_301550 [Rubroshorea leprosula]
MNRRLRLTANPSPPPPPPRRLQGIWERRRRLRTCAPDYVGADTFGFNRLSWGFCELESGRRRSRMDLGSI